MKYVVIQTGGKQYRVSEGDVIEVEHLASEKDQAITFNEVLLYANGNSSKIGMPFVDGISVGAMVIDHIRGEKIRVAKFKAKARHRRVTGHRQSLTRIKIEAIHDGKPRKQVEAAVVEAETVKTEAPVKVKKAAKAE